MVPATLGRWRLPGGDLGAAQPQAVQVTRLKGLRLRSPGFPGANSADPAGPGAERESPVPIEDSHAGGVLVAARMRYQADGAGRVRRPVARMRTRLGRLPGEFASRVTPGEVTRLDTCVNLNKPI